MDRQWNSDLQIQSGAMVSLPPAVIGETGWDVLLALSGDHGSGLNLDKLAPLVSVTRAALLEWLDWLGDRRLVASGRHKFSNELGAILTPAGRELVEHYMLATSGLTGPTRH